MNRTLSKLVLLASLTLTAPQIGCGAIDARVDTAIEQRERSVNHALEDIMTSVYCVRTESRYRRAGASEDTPAVTRTGHGSAFAFDRRDGYTYLVTSLHVVNHPENIRRLEITPSPTGGIRMGVVVYEREDGSSKLVRHGGDRDASDDVEIEVVSRNEDADIAIVRTPRELHVADSYVRDESIRPGLNEEVYVLGYPQAFANILTRGSVAHPGLVSAEGTEYDALDTSAAPGNSGGPYMIRRGNDLYWGGIVGRARTHRRTRVPLVLLATPLRVFSYMLHDDESMMDTYDAGPLRVPIRMEEQLSIEDI